MAQIAQVLWRCYAEHNWNVNSPSAGFSWETRSDFHFVCGRLALYAASSKSWVEPS